MIPRTLRRVAATAAPCLLTAAPALAQDEDLEERVDELEAQLDALSLDYENLILSDVIPGLGPTWYGLGPAASKVYNSDQGLSIGGYGELRYQNFRDDDTSDEFDLTRAVFYFGYKFDEHWVFNSEIEIEHADEVFAEFAYLDYLAESGPNYRVGLVLVPMGLLNELHEPTTYLGADRPLTETWIIPSTWRANGGGIFGDAGGFDYKLYVVNGLNGANFGGESGLRGGRQKGSQALAEDFAVVGSLNWTDTPGWIVGVSAYSGQAGQDQGIGDLDTTILEAHADWRSGPLWARGLVADASVDDRDAGDMDLSGWYLEAGYDVLPQGSGQLLYPYLRFEDVDTDEDSGGIDDTALTYGLHWRPIDQIVFKLDHSDFDDTDNDVTTLLVGYVF